MASASTTASSLQSLFVIVRDTNTGIVNRIAVPADMQIGLTGNPAELMLTGRLSLNEASYASTAANQGIININNDDTVVGVNLMSGSIPSGSAITTNLPGQARNGELHIIKDETGTAGSLSPINVVPPLGLLIDGQPFKQISSDYGSMMIAWWNGSWFTVGGGGGGGSPGPKGDKGDKGNTGDAGPEGPIGPSGSIGPPAQPYQTIFDLDFTTQSNQTLAPDRDYTIGGITWTKENTRNELITTELTNGVGIVFTPSTSVDTGNNADYNFGTTTSGQFGPNNSRTIPLLRAPFSQFTALDNMSWQTKLRLWVGVTTAPSIALAGRAFAAIDYGPNLTTNQGSGSVMLSVWTGTCNDNDPTTVATGVTWMYADLTGSAEGSNEQKLWGGPPGAMMLELDRTDGAMGGGCVPFYGDFAGNWPSYFDLHRAGAATGGSPVPLALAPIDVRNMGIVIGFVANNAFDQGSIQRIRLDALVIEASVTSGSSGFGSGSINVEQNGTTIGGPYNTLNFTGDVVVSDMGGARAEIAISGSSTSTTVSGVGGSSVSNTGSAYTVSSSIGAVREGLYVVVHADAENPNERVIAVTGGTSLSDGGAGGNLTLSSSVGADKFASYVLLGPNANNTKARTLVAGTNITLADGGAGGNLTISSTATASSSSAGWIDGGTGIYTTSSVSIDSVGHVASFFGLDQFLHVSGTVNVSGSSAKIATFVGDMFSSGSMTALTGFTGSLTKLPSGLPYMVALGSVTITTNSLGQLIISGSGGGGGTSPTVTNIIGAGGTAVSAAGTVFTVSSSISSNASASYALVTSDVIHEPNSRVLTASGGTSLVDNGPGSTLVYSSSVGADLYASYLLVSASSADPHARVLVAQGSVTLIDNGPGSTLIISGSGGGGSSPTVTSINGAGGSAVSNIGTVFTVSSSVAADVFGGYLLVAADTKLSQSRVLTAGTNITFSDAGAGSTFTINAATGSGGSSSGFSVVPLANCVSSTGNDGTNPKKVGGISFNAGSWSQLKSTSTIIFHMLLETTNAANPASGSLLMYTGVGSPQTVVTLNTGSLNTADLSANVSTFFKSGSNPGIFFALLNLTTNNGVDFATSTGAWLEVTP